MKHCMKLKREPLEKIESGAKKYELRLYDEKRRLLRVGDTIEFTCEETAKKLTVTVTSLLGFGSFEELYSALPLSECGYTPQEAEKASPRDMEKYYSRDEQRKYGVLAIGIE